MLWNRLDKPCSHTFTVNLNFWDSSPKSKKNNCVYFQFHLFIWKQILITSSMKTEQCIANYVFKLLKILSERRSLKSSNHPQIDRLQNTRRSTTQLSSRKYLPRGCFCVVFPLLFSTRSNFKVYYYVPVSIAWRVNYWLLLIGRTYAFHTCKKFCDSLVKNFSRSSPSADAPYLMKCPVSKWRKTAPQGSNVNGRAETGCKMFPKCLMVASGFPEH